MVKCLTTNQSRHTINISLQSGGWWQRQGTGLNRYRTQSGPPDFWSSPDAVVTLCPSQDKRKNRSFDTENVEFRNRDYRRSNCRKRPTASTPSTETAAQTTRVFRLLGKPRKISLLLHVTCLDCWSLSGMRRCSIYNCIIVRYNMTLKKKIKKENVLIIIYNFQNIIIGLSRYLNFERFQLL